MTFGPSAEQIANGMDMVDRHFAQQSQVLALLTQIAQDSGAGLQTISIAEQEVQGGLEVDFPVEGSKRWVIPRVASGGSFVVTEALVLLLSANNRRLGGRITNTGEKNLVLKLASANNANANSGIGTITLKPGEHWDFLLGQMLWCGSICAEGEGGETKADVVEV